MAFPFFSLCKDRLLEKIKQTFPRVPFSGENYYLAGGITSTFKENLANRCPISLII
jgi:hypothetical protein